VPFRLLEPVPELSCGEADTANLIVQGDNLHALKALLPRYAGQVKCIYIDPPYNTGNEGWVYNDNVNSPEIRRWLGEVVGKEGETLDRHDRWLSMMYPRLVLLKQFLRDDGAIFISIDDNEVATLRLLMDEIFGAKNFVATVLWQKIFSPKNSARHLSEDHDYIVIYACNANAWKPNLLPRGDDATARYKNPGKDVRGAWASGDLQARNYYSEGTYPVTCPSGRVISGPGKGMYWRVSKANFDKLDKDGRIWWGESGNNMPRLKRYLSDVKEGIVPQTMWFYKDVGHTQEAKKELLELVDFDTSDDVFITPKPSRLIQRILQIATDKDSLVLDSFAGSGTTGHAVLKQNVEDGGSRRFILVEMDGNIAQNVTAERVLRVCEGYERGKNTLPSPSGGGAGGEGAAADGANGGSLTPTLYPFGAPRSQGEREKNRVPGLGGGFQFCTLSQEPLFTADGAIRADVTFAQLAEFVWFMETGNGLAQSALTPDQPRTPLLGQYRDRAVFLLYNGILKDKTDTGGNVLNSRTLEILNGALPGFSGQRVVYGARNRFDKARLKALGLEFKQLPYELAAKTWA
jgi:site-specific DNA-methyltransferase (adenine-specific)/adenine-specific DNA-methyltransferase